MNVGKRVLAVFAVFSLGFVLFAAGGQAATQDPQESIPRLRDELKQAGTLVLENKLAEAAVMVEKTQTELILLAASAEEDARLRRQVEPLLTRLEVLRRVLKRNCTELAAWPSAEDAGTVSFSQDIAPIFIARCNNCHVQGTRGGFNMASYQALMRGSAGGVVVRAQNVTGSRLFDVLETGDMPRGGGQLPPEQLTAIKTWIEEGAKFDGADESTPLAELVSADPAAPSNANAPPAPELVRAKGDEDVLFSRDIAPVIVEQCLNCHGANNPSGQLGLNTFTRLLNGGQAGPIIASGKPNESLLISKLKGTADGQRMPLRRQPLSADVIAKFEAWIADGAKFDGPDGGTATATVAQLFRVSQMSFDELSAERKKSAQQMWRTAHPNVLPDEHESEHFFLMGTVGSSQLEEFAKQAEEMWSKVAQGVRLRNADWPLGGRVTLFVFDRRFEYSEFGRMVERRDVPRQAQANRVYNTVDAYIAVLAGEARDQEELAPLVTEQLAGLYFSSLGNDVPDWFSNGFGREVMARIHPRDDRVRSWIDAAPAAKAQLNNPAALLNGRAPATAAPSLEHNFAAFLMQNARAFQNLLRLLQQGTEFEAAFGQAYGGTPLEAVNAWSRQSP